MFDDIRLGCCDPFVQWYGMPAQFVNNTIPKPADFLFEYEQQLNELNTKLKEMGACEHYTRHARIFLRKRCDEMLNCLAEGAEFLGWPPSYIEQLVNEGAWEALLS